MTAEEIIPLAQNAGFSGQDLQTAVQVALAESSGNPSAWGDAGIGQGSFGLWQINAYWHPEFGPDFSQLYDPQTNANAAFSVYSKAGNSFSPWSSFKTGAYGKYAAIVANALSAAYQAVSDAASNVVQTVEDNPETSSDIGILLVVGLALLFLMKKA